MLANLSTIQQIKNKIDEAKTILAVTHQEPDGDGLGAISALAQYFKLLKKDYNLFCLDKPIDKYLFLPSINEITVNKEVFGKKYDLVMVVDAGDLKYAGIDNLLVKENYNTLINIDHHISNNNFGDINLVLADKSSASEIIYNLFRIWRTPINKDMATALLNGIIFDTGMFSNSATSLASLQAASHLLNLGARHFEINQNLLRSKSLGLLKLWGRAFERLEFNPNYNLAFTVVTLKDMEECGVDNEASLGLSNFFNELAGAKVAMVLIEQSDGTVKGSLRTTADDVDVSKLAVQFGGGGHKKAAGFSIKGKLLYNGFNWTII